MAILHASPTTTSASDDHGVGNVFESKDGKKYKWVEVVDVDLAIGYVVCPASTDGTKVTADVSGGSQLALRGIGVALGTVDISDKKYAFIQVAGVADVYSDGSVAAGEAVVADSGTNGLADTMADGEEEQVFGWALEADSGSPVTCACWLVGCI